MTSWRDSASPGAQEDLDGLLDAALPFAQQMLEKHGEFLPYGVAIEVSGRQRMLAGDPDGSDTPASLDVLEVIVLGMRSERDDLRAVALVADVRLADSDAIRVEVEHREGTCLAALLPYRRKRFGRGYEFGDLVATPSRSQVWPDVT